MALSGDGNLALIGGPGDSSNVGAVWVFTRSNGVWTDQGPKLTGAGETGAGQFGASVSLSGDGSTALIGGPADNGGRGAAWVFTRSGSTWTQQGSKLTGSDESGAGRFGASVALSEERRHRADRRFRRQRRCGSGVGVHPLRLDLDPARIEADRRG